MKKILKGLILRTYFFGSALIFSYLALTAINYPGWIRSLALVVAVLNIAKIHDMNRTKQR